MQIIEKNETLAQGNRWCHYFALIIIYMQTTGAFQLILNFGFIFVYVSKEGFSEIGQCRDRAKRCSGDGQMARKRQSDEIF